MFGITAAAFETLIPSETEIKVFFSPPGNGSFQEDLSFTADDLFIY